MQPEKPKRATKTFPLEIEDDLHKALKVRAIEEDKTLHSLIIETLSSRLQEEPARYQVTKPKEERNEKSLR
jgi:predicted HicB family RNase H-like nuclease